MNDAIERLEAWQDVHEQDRRVRIECCWGVWNVALHDRIGGDEVFFNESLDGRAIGLAATINMAIDEAERRWGKP